MCLLVLKNCFCLSFTGCRSEKAFTQEKKMQRKDFRPWNVIRETQEGFLQRQSLLIQKEIFKISSVCLGDYANNLWIFCLTVKLKMSACPSDIFYWIHTSSTDKQLMSLLMCFAFLKPHSFQFTVPPAVMQKVAPLPSGSVYARWILTLGSNCLCDLLD